MFWPLSLCVIAALAPVPAEAQSSNRFVVGCPARCDKSMCPRPPADCAAGQTLDACNCCPVCASGEGEACGGSGKLGDPVCGEGLECSVPGGVAYTITVRRRSRSGTCACKSSEPVCGSDGVSYRNICELKRVSRRAQKLQQPPVLFIQRGACGKGRPRTRCRTSPEALYSRSLFLLPACFSPSPRSWKSSPLAACTCWCLRTSKTSSQMFFFCCFALFVVSYFCSAHVGSSLAADAALGAKNLC